MESFNVHYSNWVREALDELPDSFTITDPSISGNPIVYVSQGFLKMSGYSKGAVIGQNGRMFQGPATNRRSVMEIREAIREERTIEINLLNYRKDGTPFWMLFHMSPLFSEEDGRVMHFVAVQVPIRRRRCSGSGVNLCEDRSRLQENVYGSCRWESSHVLAREIVWDSDNGAFDVEEPCEANDFEKQKAATAINNIFSVLIHYSESTGRLVSEKRCNLSGTALLGSSFTISLGRIKQSFVLIDPHSPDMPIVYASEAFLRLTGYARHEVLGRNCRILSGVDTDSSTQQQIDESIQNERPCTVRILNYRKDKSSFWNLLHISPVRNASGKVAYFAGVHIEEGGNNQDERGWSVQMKQLSVVGAIKVAVRSLSMGAAPSEA
uniref:Putative LOV domain-containing protein n=1 Tax=Daenikera sp. BC-2016 TaxID=1799573 RepID=A0A126WVF4_9MAGN|nr:putative LOV domain-containing protein [Daenikera sp. BC-2016]